VAWWRRKLRIELVVIAVGRLNLAAVFVVNTLKGIRVGLRLKLPVFLTATRPAWWPLFTPVGMVVVQKP